MKVLLTAELKRFHLNGNTIGVHSQTQSLNNVVHKRYRIKVLLKRFHLIGKTIRFNLQSQIEKLELHSK